MNKQLIQKITPHLTAVFIFLIISAIYFSPQLKGDKLHQGDQLQYQGMSKEIVDFRNETGEEALWTNSTFGGMPAYQISVKSSNLVKKTKDLVLKIIPRPIGYIFFSMIGFYILLLCFNVNPWLAIIGGIAFGLSSINMLYLAGGHNAKVHAISFIPPIIGGIFFAYRKNYITGAALVSLFVSWHLSANHFQMTYYLLYLILAVVGVELYLHFKNGLFKKFVKISSVLLIAGILGALPIFSNLFLTYEYSKYTTRGESELTITADNNTINKVENEALNSDYIKQYSLGFGEVWSLVIPDVKGGRMNLIGNKKEIIDNVNPNYKNTVAQQASYWGEQASSGGAFYFGVSVFLLFVLGMFMVKDKFKWALLAVSLLAIILSWKYGSIVDWFIANVPLFDKFRDTKMMLILVQLSFPLLGFLFVNTLLKSEINKKHFIYISLGVIGLILIFYVMPTVWFDFFNRAEVAQFDKLLASYKSNPNALMQIRELKDEIVSARIEIFKKDCFRSLFFVLSTALIIYLFIIKKVKQNAFLLILGVIILVDLWGVDKRYLNDENFVSKRQEKQFFQMTEADKYILRDKDPNYRVLNYTVSPFNDASTSYYHKSLGGYHGAKLKRYQELIEYQISKNNMDVFNMLNTKYFIVPDNNKQPLAQLNPDALGNAWFVEDFRIVPDADAEIQALSEFNPSQEAIIDARFEDFVAGKDFTRDTLSNIKLDSYKPNHLIYSANCSEEKLAVFSEIYYPKGWNAYIDGQDIDHFRVNYVLRGLVLPEGEHTVEFKFEPKSYYIGQKVSFTSSVLLLLVLLFVLGREGLIFYKKNYK
ncbi:MAG: YfhO family protein [Bacteroidales bacterium]|nr:YfhO family protein [Bacteroidales bacterium]